MPDNADFELECNVYHKAPFDGQEITIYTDTFTIIGMPFEMDSTWPDVVYLPRTTADQTGILVKQLNTAIGGVDGDTVITSSLTYAVRFNESGTPCTNMGLCTTIEDSDDGDLHFLFEMTQDIFDAVDQEITANIELYETTSWPGRMLASLDLPIRVIDLLRVEAVPQTIVACGEPYV